jgi:outer membrane protein insertion porin family
MTNESGVDDLAPWQGLTVLALELEGNEVTRERVIRREIRTAVGEPLDLGILREDYLRLQNLEIFSAIRIEASPGDAGEVRLRFVVKESHSWLPLLAMTYTEENGFSAGPGISALNLTGRNIKLSGRAYFGGTTQYWADLRWPWMYGENHNSLRAFFARRDRDDSLRGFRETSDELTVDTGRYLGEHGRGRVALSYLRMRSDVAGITLTPADDDTLLRLGLILGWDTRDAWRNPRSGWQNELEVWKTGGPLGGDGDFWSMTLDLRRFLPTASHQKLLLGGLLSLQSGTYGQDVPVYLDYRMGGANTIRGYDVEDLGRRIFGKNQLIGTAEYSWNVLPLRRVDLWFLSVAMGLDLTVFGDVGVAWNEPEELSMRRTRGGLGAGVRILVPGTEMTRLDVGWSPEGGFQFHFGAWSKPSASRFRLR